MNRYFSMLSGRPFRGPGLAVLRLSRWICLIWLAADGRAFGQITPGTNLITATGGALPDAGSSVFRVLGALALVTAIFLGGVWLFRNWQRLSIRKGNSPRLNVIEVKSLGQRQSLFVVGYEQQRMLLASSPAGVTLVTHLPVAEEVQGGPQAAARMSFTEAFQQVLSRK
jgi:flagellar biogenesis protein FliO